MFEREKDCESVEFIELVAEAKKKDAQLEVFGATSHKYQFNPVATMEEVMAFEEKYGLKLPEAYVAFLTKVGNGGAGPYYGLYSLKQVESYNSEWLHQDASRTPMIDKSLTMEKWNAAISDDDELLDEDADEQWDEFMAGLYAGMLIIGTQGCTYDNVLMCKGSEAGKIVYIDWNLEKNYPPFLTGMTFEEWYGRFFEEIIAGRSVRGYGYTRLGSEEELLEEYKKLENMQSQDLGIAGDLQPEEVLKQKQDILSGFYRFATVSGETLDFIKNLQERELDAIRLNLLLRWDKVQGMSLFEQFLMGENPEAAVSVARTIDAEKMNQYYDRMVELLYEDNHCNKNTILFYIDDCDCKKAEAIVDFAMDEAMDEEVRKIAIYIMGHCKDAERYLDCFIGYMRGESYWLAHTALQAMIRSGIKTPALMETYLWMKEKYKHDSTMRSNLSQVV